MRETRNLLEASLTWWLSSPSLSRTTGVIPSSRAMSLWSAPPANNAMTKDSASSAAREMLGSASLSRSVHSWTSEIDSSTDNSLPDTCHFARNWSIFCMTAAWLAGSPDLADSSSSSILISSWFSLCLCLCMRWRGVMVEGKCYIFVIYIDVGHAICINNVLINNAEDTFSDFFK